MLFGRTFELLILLRKIIGINLDIYLSRLDFYIS